jgi:Ca2+-binding EF-hand superfamily protein
MEDLLDGLDNIPEIMKQIQCSPTRGRSKVRATQSFNVTAALHPDDENIVAEKFSLQADRVLKHLSDLHAGGGRGRPRSVQQLAAEALPQWDALLEKAGDAEVFRQYDVLRRGKITYGDFNDIVVSCNTGFSKAETHALALELDGGRTGLIRYHDIVSSLKTLDAKMAQEHRTKPALSDHTPKPQKELQIPSHYREGTYARKADHGEGEGVGEGAGAGELGGRREPAGGSRRTPAPPPQRRAPSSASREQDPPMLPSEVISVKSLSPSYPPSPIKRQGQGRGEGEGEADTSGKIIPLGTYNPKYFGSTMHGVLNMDVSRRERAHSAPPVRLPGPPTAEGAISKEFSRRNHSTHHVILRHDYGDKKKAAALRHAEEAAAADAAAAAAAKGKGEAGREATAKSLLRYLKAREAGSAPGGASGGGGGGGAGAATTGGDTAPFDAKAFFSPQERKRREGDRLRLQQEEIRDHEHRASKVRVNSIITQTAGNLKPLQFQLMKKDLSRSGTVTQSEFENSLHTLGIVMGKADSDALFRAHSHSVQATSSATSSIDYNTPVLHIDSFVHGLRLRGSDPVFAQLSQDSADAELPRTRYGHAVHHGYQRRHCNTRNNAESSELRQSTIATAPEDAAALFDAATPLARERARIVRKVMESNSDPTASKCRAAFLKGAALNSGKVRPEALLEQLNQDGAGLSPAEYDMLMAPLPAATDGSINVSQFSSMMTEAGRHLHNYGDLGRLGIGLSVTNQNDPQKFYSNLLCPGNVPNVTPNEEQSRARRVEGQAGAGRKFLGSTQHALLNYASGFARDKLDRRELTKDRVAWAKVVSSVRAGKDNIERIMRGAATPPAGGARAGTSTGSATRMVAGRRVAAPDRHAPQGQGQGRAADPGFAAPLSTAQLGQALGGAGVRLSGSDLRMLQAHCNATQGATHAPDSAVSLEAVCRSLGMVPARSAARGRVMAVPETDELDALGIYGAAHASQAATPTFRSSIFDAPDVSDKCWSNRKRHYHSAESNASSASNFWSMEHAPTVDLMAHPRDQFRGSMSNEHGSWNGVWPPNLSGAGHKAASSASVAEGRREMFSPYGRGRFGAAGGGGGREAAGSHRRSGSAPPLSRKSLVDLVGGGDPYATPVSTPSGRGAGGRPAAQDDAYVAPAHDRAYAAPAPAPAPAQQAARPPPPSDARDVSAAVSRWANKSLAELMAGKGLPAPAPAPAPTHAPTHAHAD